MNRLDRCSSQADGAAVLVYRLMGLFWYDKGLMVDANVSRIVGLVPIPRGPVQRLMRKAMDAFHIAKVVGNHGHVFTVGGGALAIVDAQKAQLLTSPEHVLVHLLKALGNLHSQRAKGALGDGYTGCPG